MYTTTAWFVSQLNFCPYSHFLVWTSFLVLCVFCQTSDNEWQPPAWCEINHWEQTGWKRKPNNCLHVSRNCQKHFGRDRWKLFCSTTYTKVYHAHYKWSLIGRCNFNNCIKVEEVTKELREPRDNCHFNSRPFLISDNLNIQIKLREVGQTSEIELAAGKTVLKDSYNRNEA